MPATGERQSGQSQQAEACRLGDGFDPVTLLAALPGSLEITELEGLRRGRIPNIVSPSTGPEICRTVSLMIDELRDRPSGYQMSVTSLAGLLMVQLKRISNPEPVRPDSGVRANMSRISPALHHLARHYTEEIEIEDLAELCHLSLSQFRRLFVATTGVPPLQYLVRVRIRMAAGILRDQPDKSIMTVASESGV